MFAADLTGNVTEYIPVPVIDKPGFVMVLVVCEDKKDAEEDGCWCTLIKNDEYLSGFQKFFHERTGQPLRAAFKELHEYCGATIEDCRHAESKPDHAIQAKFEYLLFPDMDSFMRGCEWLDARWLSGKLNNPEK